MVISVKQGLDCRQVTCSPNDVFLPSSFSTSCNLFLGDAIWLTFSRQVVTCSWVMLLPCLCVFRCLLVSYLCVVGNTIIAYYLYLYLREVLGYYLRLYLGMSISIRIIRMGKSKTHLCLLGYNLYLGRLRKMVFIGLIKFLITNQFVLSSPTGMIIGKHGHTLGIRR